MVLVRKFVIAAFILAAAPGLCRAEPVGLPLGDADRVIVGDLDASVQDGSPERLQAFAETHMASATPLPDVLAALGAFRGRLEPQGARRMPDGTMDADFTLDGSRLVRVTMVTDAKIAGRVAEMFVVPRPAPYPKPLLDRPASLAALRAAIADRVDFAVARGEFSGVVIVAKDGKAFYRSAHGMADRGKAIPIDLQTRFNLGSMDKQFTAVAIGQLIEKGRFQLDTRLSEILPDYPSRANAEKITIRHLLTHSAGLGMLWERAAFEHDRDYGTISNYLPVFASEPLAFEPGTSSAYSNEGFLVLGAVVEKVSGENWYDYVRRHIFEPAGMSHTGYPVKSAGEKRLAVGYAFPDDDLVGLRERQDNSAILIGRGSSMGGGYSTAGDMINFLTALRAHRLLGAAMTDTLTAPGSGMADYGMGFEVRPEHGRTVRGHDGGGPWSGINADAKAVWENGYAYAVLGNYDAPFAQALGQDIAAMLAAQD